MTYDSLSISELIPAPPERIYAAWLSSDEHSAFTGDKAVVEPFVGGTHSTFDGYAVGRTVELQPGRRIVQTWRAEDFPLGSPDSRVEVTLEETVGGTMLTILHTEIPSGQGTSCRDGWVKFYLEPLKGYFVAAKPKTNGVPSSPPKGTSVVVRPHPAAPTKAPAKKPARRPKVVAKKAARKAPTKKTPAKAKTRTTKPTKRPAEKTTKRPTKRPAKKTTKRAAKPAKSVARRKAPARKKPARRR